jgi:hypothetical protein
VNLVPAATSAFDYVLFEKVGFRVDGRSKPRGADLPPRHAFSPRAWLIFNNRPKTVSKRDKNTTPARSCMRGRWRMREHRKKNAIKSICSSLLRAREVEEAGTVTKHDNIPQGGGEAWSYQILALQCAGCAWAATCVFLQGVFISKRWRREDP